MSEPITTPQLRTLHALGKQRGFDHEELRRVLRVTSLKDLTKDAAGRIIDNWQSGQPRRYREASRPSRPRLAPGTMRPASSAQRNKIGYLLRDLGWKPEVCKNWLFSRHLVRDHQRDPLSTTTASRIITELTQALRHSPSSTPAKEGHSNADSTRVGGGAIAD